MWTRETVWLGSALALCSALACSADRVSATDSNTGSEAGSESESGFEPDLPPAEPECPAALGEVVECECALVDACHLGTPEPGACALGCEDLPSPCPTVTCTFNSAYTLEPACTDELDVVALECVFSALAEGQPLSWSMDRSDSYPFAWDYWATTYLRLGPSTYLYAYDRGSGNDTRNFGAASGFSGLELPDLGWQACDGLASDHERFDCLLALAHTGEPCADPSLLVCP